MLAAEETDALDAMTTAPDHHEVILENDHVRVLDTRLGPGERTPVHSHRWPSSLYVISWSDFLRRDADGNVIVNRRTLSGPELSEMLKGLVQLDADQAVVIRGDEAGAYKNVVGVLNICSEAGVTNVAFATAK